MTRRLSPLGRQTVNRIAAALGDQYTPPGAPVKREPRIGTTFLDGNTIRVVKAIGLPDVHGAHLVQTEQDVLYAITYDQTRRWWVGVRR